MVKMFSKSSQFTTFALAGLDVGNIMRIKGRQMWSGETRWSKDIFINAAFAIISRWAKE